MIGAKWKMHISSDSEILKYASFYSDLLFLSVSQKIKTIAGWFFLIWLKTILWLKTIFPSNFWNPKFQINQSILHSINHSIISWQAGPHFGGLFDKSTNKESMTWLDNDSENGHNVNDHRIRRANNSVITFYFGCNFVSRK